MFWPLSNENSNCSIFHYGSLLWHGGSSVFSILLNGCHAEPLRKKKIKQKCGRFPPFLSFCSVSVCQMCRSKFQRHTTETEHIECDTMSHHSSSCSQTHFHHFDAVYCYIVLCFFLLAMFCHLPRVCFSSGAIKAYNLIKIVRIKEQIQIETSPTSLGQRWQVRVGVCLHLCVCVNVHCQKSDEAASGT